MSQTRSQRQLEAIAQDAAAVAQRFAALEARVRDEHWNRRPTEHEWSVAECIAHLNISSAAMLPRMRAAFEEARKLPPVGDRAYKGTMFGKLLAKMVGPVPQVLGFRLGRVKTPPAFVPGSDLPRAAVVAEFRRWLGEELELIRSASGLAVDQVTLDSPFVAGAKYDGFSSLKIVVNHEMRHLVQAERALARVESR